MTYKIEKIDEWPSGDTRVFPFTVPNEDDESSEFKDITNADITYKIKDPLAETVVLDDSNSDVNINIVDATNGELEVRVEKEATQDLDGKYREIIQITDALGNRASWTGKIHIENID